MYATGFSPTSIIVGDFNNDRKLDIVVTNNNNNSVSMLLGNGNGTFQNRTTYSTGGSPRSIQQVISTMIPNWI
jgi:hypothetical protein